VVQIPVAARSKAWGCGRSLAGTVVSNPAEGMDVCLLWVLCVVRSLRRADRSGRHFYRLWFVFLCDLKTSRMNRWWLALGRSAKGGKNVRVLCCWGNPYLSIAKERYYIYIYNGIIRLLIFVLYLVVEAEPVSEISVLLIKRHNSKASLMCCPIQGRITAFNVALQTICRNFSARCCKILWSQ
jgi:hypothetical protein